MIAKTTCRQIAVLGLAVLGGCAGPGAGKSKPPPGAKAPAAVTAAPTTPAAPAPEERPAAPPAIPPPPEARSGAPAPPPLGAPATPPGRGTTQATPGRPITPPARSGRQIVLNFDNADIEAVIQAASEIAGFNYTIGPGVAGKKVTIQTSGRIPEDEIFNVLLAVLEVNGVTAIRSGNLYKILPTPAAREHPLPTVIGAQADPTRRDDEMITQIVPLQYAAADRLAATLRPFVQGGNLIVQGSLMIITDTAANVARLLQIVSVLDVEVTTDELRLVPVRFADAVELGRMLNEFFSGRRARTPAATVPVPAPAPPRPGAPPAPGAVPGAAADSGDRPPLIIADKRTNVLVVSGRRADVELASKLAGQLDVDTQANKRVFVYYVENVKAKELATTLTEIFGKPGEGVARPARGDVQSGTGGPYQGTGGAPSSGPLPPLVTVVATGSDIEPSVVEGQVKVVADEPNNALIVTTFPRNWPLIEDTIRKLDRTPKQVLIEVLVAEVGLNDENRLGLEWTLRTQRDVTINGTPYNVGSVSRVDVGPLSPLPGSQAAPTLSGIGALAGAPATAGLSFLLFETDRFLGMLNLYANYGQLTVLSSPTIMTSENKKAVINVSNSVPIVTQQQVSASTATGQVVQQQQVPSQVLTQSVEYRDAGIILTVTPRISDKRVVALDVKQTVNDVGDPRPPSLSPDIIKREAETSVVLRDNQTLVLGGLIRTRRTSTKQGIPWLSKIPLIGFLFGATVDRMERTELLLLITPRVIGDPSEGQDIYQQVRGQRPGLEKDLRTHPSILRPETEPATP
ncbi:MAG TPA: type II secretion system secretin GspD [Methylomirabilota bacterium]|jgi:general secretion pathway protein D